jgi:hypothetical protein
LPDLSLFLPLSDLVSFQLKLGGTRNLTLLPRIGQLRYLHLWLIRGLSNVAPIGDMKHLEMLFIQALPNVQRLPDLRSADALRRFVLCQMRGITDLTPLAAAPALRDLALLSMPQLDANSFLALSRSKSIERVEVWLRSKNKHRLIKRILGDRVSFDGGEFPPLMLEANSPT